MGVGSGVVTKFAQSPPLIIIFLSNFGVPPKASSKPALALADADPPLSKELSSRLPLFLLLLFAELFASA